jgi:hypothetical protein
VTGPVNPCACGLRHSWPDGPGDTCGGDHPWTETWGGPKEGPGEVTRTWQVVGVLRDEWLVHAPTAVAAPRGISRATRLRYDGVFRIAGGAAKVSVHAFHVLDGDGAGCCLLLESHWTDGLAPFLEMHAEVAPLGPDPAELRRRAAAIVTGDPPATVPGDEFDVMATLDASIEALPIERYQGVRPEGPDRRR